MDRSPAPQVASAPRAAPSSSHRVRTTLLAARDAPVAVVIARGPSDWTRLHRWDLRTDAVESGQWLHARVFPRRCDLSPDGRLLSTFAHDGRAHRDAASWVSISQPPLFTALAWWAMGTTWVTGLFFPDDTSVVLGLPDPPDRGSVPRWFSTAGTPLLTGPPTAGTDTFLTHNRLARDGWTSVDAARAVWRRAIDGVGTVTVHDPHLPPPGSDPLGAAPRWELVAGDAPVVLDVHSAAVGGDGTLLASDDRSLLRWDADRGALRTAATLEVARPEPTPPPADARRWPPPEKARPARPSA